MLDTDPFCRLKISSSFSPISILGAICRHLGVGSIIKWAATLRHRQIEPPVENAADATPIRIIFHSSSVYLERNRDRDRDRDKSPLKPQGRVPIECPAHPADNQEAYPVYAYLSPLFVGVFHGHKIRPT